MSNKYGFHTLALHAGAEIDKYYLPVLFICPFYFDNYPFL